MQRRNIKLSSLEDIFSKTKADDIQMIPIVKVSAFKNHPFKVLENEEMHSLIESVKELGVIVPTIVRRLESGYEMISGHRRLKASILAGKEEIPAIVKEMDDATATLLMVDANLQREHILPSERARAYKMKLVALKHQGKTSSRPGTKSRADEIIAQDEHISRNQVQRFVRLNHLIPELLDFVDAKKIAFNPAVELSYMKLENQELFYEFIKDSSTSISLLQALHLKKMDKENAITTDAISECLLCAKSPSRIIFRKKELQKFFPKDYSVEQMQESILHMLQGMKVEDSVK